MFHRRANHRGARARYAARKLGYECRTEFTLQVAETEAEPKTVIRYIITPAVAGAKQVATK